mgnify:CR=1 FL=1
MKIGRRGFLKLASGLVVASVAAPAAQTIEAVTAPLYIPPERLDMGVPRALGCVAPPPWQAEVDQFSALYQRGLRSYDELISWMAPGDELTAERINESVATLRGTGYGTIRPVRAGDEVDWQMLAGLEEDVARHNAQVMQRMWDRPGVHTIPHGYYPMAPRIA